MNNNNDDMTQQPRAAVHYAHDEAEVTPLMEGSIAVIDVPRNSSSCDVDEAAADVEVPSSRESEGEEKGAQENQSSRNGIPTTSHPLMEHRLFLLNCGLKGS